MIHHFFLIHAILLFPFNQAISVYELIFYGDFCYAVLETPLGCEFAVTHSIPSRLADPAIH